MADIQKIDLGSEIENGRVVYKSSHIQKNGERCYLFITRRPALFFRVYISNEEFPIKCVKRNPSFEACYLYCLKLVKESLNLTYKKNYY